MDFYSEIFMQMEPQYFFCLYFHIGRGIYFKSYIFKETWNIGVIILLVIIGTAFIGYVLPWGQISFWGSTVITNLLSSIPYLGNYLVQWIWGGFSVRNPTLTRFFCIHFILPFIIIAITIIHLFFLHITGSNNPLGINRNINKISFNPFFSIKDLIGFIFLFIILLFIVSFYPYYLGDRDNFILANPLVTPEHIQPEWYFFICLRNFTIYSKKIRRSNCFININYYFIFHTIFKYKKNKKKSILPI